MPTPRRGRACRRRAKRRGPIRRCGAPIGSEQKGIGRSGGAGAQVGGEQKGMGRSRGPGAHIGGAQKGVGRSGGAGAQVGGVQKGVGRSGGAGAQVGGVQKGVGRRNLDTSPGESRESCVRSVRAGELFSLRRGELPVRVRAGDGQAAGAEKSGVGCRQRWETG